MKLTGNTILLTGGAVGIGLEMARALAQDNRVLICGRRAERLKQAQEELPRLETFACDLGSAQGRRDLAAWAIARAPALNVVIHNAGVQHRLDFGKDASGAALGNEGHYEELAINLEAPMHLSALLLPQLAKQEVAAIVNVTSGLAFTPYAAVPVYSATKAALHSFSLSLRHQLRHTSVRVFEVAPPLVESELHDHQEGVVLRGAMPTRDFVAAFLKGWANDVETNLVGAAAKFHDQPKESFGLLNPDAA